ncbi:MAG TPA: 50S ribosomal protein L3, partial [Solirubrobacterales bacterium]|nr:50S ribosomal protein L3 [Solirubrobacterales bacterium]
MSAILGIKLGMTRLFDEDGVAVPVTVIEAAPNVVTAIRNGERDGYDAVQLAAVPTEERKLTKGELGHLKKASAGAMRRVVEFRDVGFPAGGGGEGEGEGAAAPEGAAGAAEGDDTA